MSSQTSILKSFVLLNFLLPRFHREGQTTSCKVEKSMNVLPPCYDGKNVSLVSFDYQEFNYSSDSKYFLVQIFVHRIILLSNDLYWQVPQWPWFETHQRRQPMTLAMFGAFAEASCIVYIFLNIYDWSFIECVHASICRKQVKTYEDSDGNSADAGPLNGIEVR